MTRNEKSMSHPKATHNSKTIDNPKTPPHPKEAPLEFINPNQDTRIGDASQVVLHFAVSLENGTLIDSTFNRSEPVSLTIGDGNLLPGFEKVLMNLRAGDTRSAHLDPSQAFGDWNAANVQTFSKTQFALTAAHPKVGMMIEFEDKGKNTLPGVVSRINEDEIVVDFNHPLAGQAILFKVQIIKVTPAGQTGIKLM